MLSCLHLPLTPTTSPITICLIYTLLNVSPAFQWQSLCALPELFPWLLRSLCMCLRMCLMSNSFQLMCAPIQSTAWSFYQPHVSMFTCVLSHYTVAITITHTRPTKQASHIPLGKNCSVLDNLTLSLGSRKIVVWGIWCGGVRDCLHVQQCGLHGMRKMWSEEDVTMLTLSNGIVTPSVCLSYQRQRNEAVTYTKKESKGEKELPDKMLGSCWRVLFFRAVLECKKEKICVYFCDGYRVFHFMPH